MSIYASEFLKWLRIFGVTTGGGPAPTGALLAINNLDDVLNSTTSIENLGLGRPGILILTDADFAGAGGTYVLTNPPPIYVSMSATSPGRVLQLPPQNQATSLQGSEDIRLIVGDTSEAININNGAGTLVHQVAAGSSWQAIPNDRSTIAGAWEFLGVVMTINGNHTGDVVLGSDPQTIYVAPSGSNINGNGSVLFPYATLSHALAVATPSPSTPYEINMQTGVYTETNLTLKPNVLINGNQSTLTISGTIDLDVSWGGGGFLYWLAFSSLTLPATVTLDFTSVFAPFALFVFGDNIMMSTTSLDVKGAIFISKNNFGFSGQIEYTVEQCYGAIQGGASGNINLTDVGNYSVIGMTEIGDFIAIANSDMTILHEASQVVGNTLYHSVGNAILTAVEKGVSHLGTLTLDNGLAGGSVNFASGGLDALPILLNGATFTPKTIADALRANLYFSPSNYTPLPGPPGEWIADSVTGNLAGIDAALASGGGIPPAYAEGYFQGNTQDTVFTFPNTPVKVRATAYNAGELDGFTLVDGTFTYTGLALRTVQLTAMLTATYEGTVQNTSFYITKNGVPLAKSKQTSAIGFVTPSPEPLPVQATSQVITGDTFELWVSNDDNTNAITVVDLNYSINGMSGSSANAGVPPAYAEMFFQNNATPTPIANVNLPTKVIATYTGDMLKDFTHSNGTLTYQGAVSKVFVIDADLTATYAGTAQNTSFYIAVNGAVVAKSKQKTFIGPVTPADMPNPCHAVVTLNFGNTVEVWVENNDNANDPTIVDFNLFVHSIDLIGTSPNVSNLEQLIWVNDLSGADTNQGTIDSPMKTYEAARLLAKARGASLASVFVIVPVGNFSITGDFIISPYINVAGLSLYNCSFSVSGSVLLDPDWQTADAPYTELSGFNFAVSTIDLDYGTVFNPSGQSYLRFQNLSLQVANVNITGAGDNINCEQVIFNNCNNDVIGAGPNYTVDNVNLQMYNTQISGAMSLSVTSAVTNATCVIQASQGPMGNMTFARPSTGKLEVHVSACETYNTSWTISGGAFVFVDAASYGFSLTLAGGATLAQLRQTSFGEGINANVLFTPSNYTPIAGAGYAANTLTANLAGIDAALATATSVVPAQMIFVDGINGSDTNNGSMENPLQSYEAARLLAVSRNPQYGSGQVIMVMTTISITGDMTISPYVSVMGSDKYCTIIGISGNFVLDAAWGSTPFAEAQISNVALIGNSIDFTFNTYTDSSIVRFENCSMQLLNAGPTATITGSDNSGNTNCETVIFNNCSLDLQPGLPEPQFITDNVNLFLFNTAVSNATNVSVTSATVAATLVIQNAVGNLANVTVSATSTGTLATQISGCNSGSAALTVNGTSNSVQIDADSYKFAAFIFGSGASFSNIKATSPIVLYVDSLSGNDNNSGSINYPMATYEAARLKAIANGASPLIVFTIMITGTQNITGDLTISPNVNIEGINPYNSGFSISGSVINDPDWGLADFVYTQVRNMFMYVGVDYTFVFTHPQAFSFLKFVNIAMNTGGFISITGSGDVGGNRETVVFENCTNDLLDYADGFTAENVDLFLINTDLTAGSVTMTASTAAAVTYNLVINNARFYTNDISVVTTNTSSLNTRINASNTMGRTLTIDGPNNTVYVDSASYMFTLALAGGATLANLVLPTKTDGMTNSSYVPSNYVPDGDTLYAADTLTGNLKGIDNKLGGMVEVLGVSTGVHTLYANGVPTTVWDSLEGTNVIDAFSLQIGQAVELSVTGTLVGIAAAGTGQLTASFGSIFSVTSQVISYAGSAVTLPMEFKMRITRINSTQITASIAGWFLTPATVLTAWNMVVSPYFKTYDETVSNAIDLKWTATVTGGNNMDFAAVNLQIVKYN